MHASAKKIFLVVVFAIAILAVVIATVSLQNVSALATDGDVYEIRTFEDFSQITDGANGKTVMLLADVDVSGFDNFAKSKPAISTFSGTFYGNGFTISGLTYTLFGSINQSAKIENLTLNADNCKSDVLASMNYGTVNDVSVYGDAKGGIVGYNYGTLTNIFSYLTINANYALVSNNEGSIEKCYLSSDITSSSESIGLFALTSTGTIYDCLYDGTVTSTSTSESTVYPFGENGVGDTCGVRVSTTATVNFDNATNSYLYDGEEMTDSTSSGFSFSDGGLPVNSSLFDFDDIKLNCENDLSKLVFLSSLQGNGFIATLDRNFTANRVIKTPVFGTVIGILSSDDKVILSSINPFVNNEYITATVSVVSAFGGDGYQGSPFTTVSGISPKGNGTKVDPYVITSEEELAYVISDETANVSGNYAIVVNDILVNNSIKGDRVLPNAEIKLNIDFCNNVLTNTYVAPFGVISGEIKNLVLILTSHESLEYSLAEEINGGIKNVTVKNANAYDSEKGFSAVNNGTISLSHNGINSTYAFCETNEGEITNCSSVSGTIVGNVTYCVTQGYHVDASGTEKDGSDYNAIKESGLDVETVFGYEVGGSETLPVIRIPSGTYRTVMPSNNVYVADGSFDYNATGVDISQEQDNLCTVDEGEATFVWYFDSEEFSETVATEVGTYTAYVTVKSDLYFTEYFTVSFTIEPADYEGTVSYEFDDVIYDYTGESITDEPNPSNMEELTGLGFSISFSYQKGSIACEKPLSSGVYTQKATLSAKNYNSITYTRKITANKKEIALSVINQEVNYGEIFDITALDETALSVDTELKGVDEGKTAKTLIEESGYSYHDFFSTNYAKGNDVGEYTVSFLGLTEIDNYVLIVTQGVLTVNHIDMSCVFDDASYEYDGLEKTIEVKGVPDGASIVYENNGRTTVGSTQVTVTVTHKNYNTCVMTANLTVEKAVITLTVSSLEKDYGYEFNPEDFTFTHSDTKNGEDYDTITQGVTFTPSVDVEVLTPNVYEVGITIEGETENYRYEIVTGNLTIGKAPLTYVFPSTSYPDITVEYSGNAVDYRMPDDAFLDCDVEITYVITAKNVEVTEIKDVGTYQVTATATPLNQDADFYEEAVYSIQVEVTIITTKITFSQSKYEYTYSGADFAFAELYPYVTEKIPDDDKSKISVYFMKSNAIVSEMVSAGEYTVVAEYVSDGGNNYRDAKATATVVINKRVAIIQVDSEYTYTGKGVVPTVEISYADGESGGLSTSDLGYSYLDKYSASYASVAEAGTYTLTVTSNNTDYALQTSSFTIKIKKLSVVITQNDISFEYGTKGEIYYDGMTITVGSDRINVNHYIEETGQTVAVGFRVNDASSDYFPINKYTITDDKIIQPNNYEFSFKNAFTVTVSKKTLEITWTVDGTEVSGAGVSLTYAGKDQISRIGYSLSGFIGNDDVTTIDTSVSVKQMGADTTLLYVGNYSVSLTLLNSPQYELNVAKTSLDVTVTKANLIAITVLDGKVMQYEGLPLLAVQIDGLCGNDAGKTSYQLRGYSVNVLSVYNPLTAKVGETYQVGGVFSFADYTIDSVNVAKGTYTVVQGYKKYSLPSATYVYDGEEKTAVVSGEIEEGVIVEYENNAHTEVGNYQVFASVIYPTGRTETLTCYLKINKATPTVSCAPTYDAYLGDKDATTVIINATAYLGNNEVLGTYNYVGSQTVTRGTNYLQVKFVPTDERNYNSVTFNKILTAYEITSSALVYSHKEYSTGDNGEILLEKPLEITLNKTGFAEIATKVQLYLNNSITNKVVLERTATERIEIRYNDQTAYFIELNVVYGKQEQVSDTVEISHLILEIDGGTFASDGKTIYLSENVAYISLADRYKTDYVLMVSGITVADKYSISDNTTDVTIVIKSKRLGVSLYYEKVEISTEQPTVDTPPTQPEGEESGFKTYYYYIIGGVVGLILIVGAVLLILKLKK